MIFQNCNIIIFAQILILLQVFLPASTLECYVCDQQEDNSGKCKSTVMTCNYLQDRCLSEIKWGSTPFWEIGAPMQYYITKGCADKEKCESMHNKTIALCERIEWRDWVCSECCQGDRCNYYITLGSASVKSSVLTLGFAIIAVALQKNLFN